MRFAVESGTFFRGNSACLRDRIMSAAWSEHFEDDTVCVELLKDQCDIILKLEPIKADFVDEVSTAFFFSNSDFVSFVLISFLIHF